MNDIFIKVQARYIEEQSAPQEQRFVYAYTVRISNKGAASAKLISRHWIITDANEQIQEVKGIGVIGEQPVIAPGDCYSYTSGAILKTETGMMHGSYSMEGEDGEIFDAEIPPFALLPPRALH